MGMRSMPLAALLLGVVLCSCSLIGGLGAGVGTAISAPIIGITAKNVIATAEESARRVLADARNAGDALAIRAANELEVAALNVSNALGQEVDKTVRALSSENQLLVGKLEELRVQAVALRHDAFKLKDSTALDLKVLLGDTWFAKRHDFWVQRVEGVTQLENQLGADYRITFQGLGFGPDSDDRRGRILGIVGPSGDVQFKARDLGAYTTEVSLANKEIQLLFKERELTVVDIELKIAVSRKRGTTWAERTFDLPLSITLMPKYGGTVTLTYFFTEGAWAPGGEQRVSATSPNCHRNNTKDPKSAFSHSMALPSTARFVPGTTGWRSVGGEGCAWHSDQNVSIGDGGHRLTFSETCDGSPCNYEYWAQSEVLDEKGAVRMGMKQQSFNFGEFLVLSVPDSTAFWTLDGYTSTLQPINLVTGQSGPILLERPSISVGHERRLIYFAKDPALME